MDSNLKIVNKDKTENNIVGKKCGSVTISIYKEITSNSPIFYVQADTEDALPLSYIIEDILSMY